MITREVAGHSKTISNRERDILNLIAGGYRDEEIAEELSLHLETVKKHQLSMMRRFGLGDISSVIDYSLRKGLINVYDVLAMRFSGAGSESYSQM